MRHSPVRPAGSGLHIHTWVVPGSSRSALVGLHGDKLKVAVTAPPSDGRANREVAALLEGALGMKVQLIRGMAGRHKVFEVSASNRATVLQKLNLAV